MTPGLPQSGFAVVGEAHLYFELAGAGEPLVMIRAGVADCRQWNNEFESLAASHRVLRYDLRLPVLVIVGAHDTAYLHAAAASWSRTCLRRARS